MWRLTSTWTRSSPRLAFWVMPYPNQRGPLWVNFRSPLLWDFFAVGTYFTVENEANSRERVVNAPVES